MNSYNSDDTKIKAPFCMTISGQSGAGKSTIAMKLIEKRRELIDIPPKSVLYCYGHYNARIPEIQKMGIKVCSGIPPDDLLEKMPKPLLLIFDDLMLQLNNKREYIAELVTRRSHHSDISILFLVQNLFEKSYKIVRDNSQYIILLNSPSAALQIRTLGTQLFPGKNGLQYFLSAYKQAVNERKFGYLVIDLHPRTQETLRLKTNILNEEPFQTIYINQ